MEKKKKKKKKEYMTWWIVVFQRKGIYWIERTMSVYKPLIHHGCLIGMVEFV